MRAGITPVVYSAFLFFPVMSNFTHHSGTTGLLLSPLWLLGYGILVFVITYSLIKGMVPADVVSEQMRAKGVLFVGDGRDERQLHVVHAHLRRHEHIGHGFLHQQLETLFGGNKMRLKSVRLSANLPHVPAV